MKMKRYKLPSSNEEIQSLIDQGMTVKQIADKFKVTYSAVYNRVKYPLERNHRRDVSELTQLIYDKGYFCESLSIKIGYSRTVVASAIKENKISMELLRCMAKELELTDNEIARIVKGELK